MMKSTIAIIAVAAGLGTAVDAQIIYTGYAESSQNLGSTAVGTYVGSVVPVLTAGQAGFSSDDLFSYRIDRGATSASATHSHFFSLQTDNLPVRLDMATGLFDGKLVFGGGGAATNYTVDLTGRVSIYEYDDANSNSKFDPGESSYLCATSGSVALASLAGNGVSLYDAPGAVPQTSYVLGANTTYFVAVESSWALAGTAALTDPSVVITVEHVSPTFNGHAATFNYTSVPEPTTAALLLGASAGGFMRRGRRRAQA